MKPSLNLRKRSYLLSIFCCAALCATQVITGCAKDDHDSFAPGNEYELVLGTRLLQTRATDTYFEPYDEIGLFAVNTVTATPNLMLLPTGNHFNNERFTLQQDGSTWVADNKVTFPTDNAPLDLYLYYPYRQAPFSMGTQIDFQVQTNQSLHSDYTRSDLATAFLDTITRRPAVVVNFYHRLSQMQFQLKNGSGYPTLNDLASAQIRILHVNTHATYDLAQDTILSTGNLQNVVPFQPTTGWVNNGTVLLGAKAIVAPQVFDANAAIEVTVGSKIYVASLAGIGALKSGKSRVFTVTIGGSGISIDTDLNDWNNDGEDPLYGNEQENDDFITKWNIMAGDTIMLPLLLETWDTTSQNNVPVYYNMRVDWGDGMWDSIVGTYTQRPVHYYATGGMYELKISGYCPYFNIDRINPYETPGYEHTRLRLTEVVQWGDVGFKTMEMAFRECSNLVSVPGKIPNVQNYWGLFQNCYSLSNIPGDLFEGCTNGKEFGSLFDGTAIQTIPVGLFDDCVNAENFGGVFSNTPIQSIPGNLFANCSKVLSFGPAFANCTSLTAIPSDLFANCPNVTSFDNVFMGCTNLTAIPSSLFVNCPNVTSFWGIFQNCTALTTIPPTLFAGCQQLTHCGYTFQGCTGLSSIPEELFAGNRRITSFYGTFQGCTGLTAIPTKFFDNNLEAYDFQYTFSGCTNLMGVTPNTLSYELWQRGNDPSEFPVTNVHQGWGCFTGCDKLTNYGSIPYNWN
ncbi:MAG: fimbrillin family protein [Culturomica sp.]|nr:fimbrillin family protein [Culturomica sp.]